MSDGSGQQTDAQYEAGIAEVKSVLFDINSTPDQREVARQALDNLTALRLGVVIGQIEGRTKLLAGLIDSLNQVIGSIQVTSPLKAVADRLTGIVGKSAKLLNSINTDFLGEGGGVEPSAPWPAPGKTR